MPTKRFDVEARLRAKGLSEFQRHMKGAGIATNRAAAAMARLQSRVRSLALFAGFGGLAAMGLAARRLARDLYEIPSAVQDAQRGLAIISQSSFGIKSYDAARQAAAGIYDELMRISDISPGNVMDYLEAFRDVSSLVQGTGASVKDLTDLTKNLVTLEKVYGFQTGVVSRDVRQILGGMGNIALIQTPQFKNISLEAAKLARQGDKAAAMRMITQAAAIDPKAIEDFGQSWSAQVDTLKNNWIRFMNLAGTPVLGWLTKQLRDANQWLKANQAKLKEFAETLGKNVIATLEWIKNALVWIHDNWRQIVETVKMLVEVWLVAKMAGALMDIISLVKNLGTALKFAFAGLGGWIGSLVVGIGAIIGGIQMLGNMNIEEKKRQRADAVSTLMGGVSPYLDILEGSQRWKSTRTQEIEIGKAAKMRRQMQMAYAEKWADLELGVYHGDPSMDRKIKLFKGLQQAKAIWEGELASEKVRRLGGKAPPSALDKIVAASAANGLTQNNDFRGSRIEVQQNFRDQDPDNVFFAFNQGIGAGIVRTASSRAPRS